MTHPGHRFVPPLTRGGQEGFAAFLDTAFFDPPCQGRKVMGRSGRVSQSTFENTLLAVYKRRHARFFTVREVLAQAPQHRIAHRRVAVSAERFGDKQQ